jgi:hypothetical protein
MGKTEIMVRRHEISDNHWERVNDLLPSENTGEADHQNPAGLGFLTLSSFTFGL